MCPWQGCNIIWSYRVRPQLEEIEYRDNHLSGSLPLEDSPPTTRYHLIGGWKEPIWYDIVAIGSIIQTFWLFCSLRPVSPCCGLYLNKDSRGAGNPDRAWRQLYRSHPV